MKRLDRLPPAPAVIFDMSVQIKTAEHDGVRKMIAPLETHIAEVRRTNDGIDPDALQAQVHSEMILNALDITLRQIQKGQEVIATSQSLLNQIAESEQNWTAFPKEPDGPPL